MTDPGQDQIATSPLEYITEFVTNNIIKGCAQFVAVEKNSVIGFCDISPNAHPGFEHCGKVGMSIVKEWRHQGLGRAPLEACIRRSIENGLTRIKLQVCSGNVPVIKPYRSLGLVEEGLKRHARFLDGHCQDLLLMALLREKA